MRRLAKSFMGEFCGYYYSSNHPSRAQRIKQKNGESLREFYQRFGELRAQVHNITEREVIEAFSYGIMTKWQFQDFCKENPHNNEEFKNIIEKMISAAEKTRERFPGRNHHHDNRDNSGR